MRKRRRRKDREGKGLKWDKPLSHHESSECSFLLAWMLLGVGGDVWQGFPPQAVEDGTSQSRLGLTGTRLFKKLQNPES